MGVKENWKKIVWRFLPLWAFIAYASIVMAVDIYWHNPVLTGLLAVVGAIVVAATCAMSESANKHFLK